MKSLSALAALYAASGIAGLVFSLIGMPLPWMIGPLIATGLLTATGTLVVRVPIQTRPFGQITVATFVGAHFTPAAFHALLQTAPLLIFVSLFIIAASVVVSIVQRRLYGTDGVTAFLSVVPTSPVEAGVLAEHHRVAPAPVIFAQTMRIALVVTIFPLMLYLAGDTSAALPPPEVDHGLVAFCVTLAGAIAGPFLFKLLRLNNPFFLGPLFMAAALSALGQPAFDIPQPVLALAQVVLGTWLGSCFTRRTFTERKSLVSSVLVTSALLLVLCVFGAWLASRVFGAIFPTMVLGFAPGGTTEMALTAGILGQDVALVTAMHLARIFVIMPNLQWLTRLTSRAGRKNDAP
ncbi:AbrB family transcriptional regulator [Oceanicola sp. 502str15]|uniref:AbrB family transcriptional regulator n=1 Tax=Oceanicola sp. 502str15 TaxID=2696061 RepID=UPI002095BDB6|nr:AbrB family transcriptional regulator [Oceanicola sp. 502str15]MCO6383050.1 AbrB family transcriptional regulator [Oceanicola sp. 502str15]